MKKRLWLIPVASLVWFLLAGLALLPYPGLQNDELFFAGPLYYPDAAFYSVVLWGHKIPVMLMSYTGALKTWLYALLFEFVAPNRWTVRLPMVVVGLGTIWLTWVWVRRMAGVRAAAVTTVLLATDTVFLITNDFDWGPVALQHLLLMAGLLAVQRWLSTDSRRMLAVGFFLWGVGMWDKALLSWPLIGLAVATVCVYPRELLRRLKPAAVGIAIISFLTGAAPLVWYNIDRPGETATTNAKFTADGLAGKVVVLRETIDGSALYDYMVYGGAAANPRLPRTGVERVSVWLAGQWGDHRTNFMFAACVAALLCLLVSVTTTSLRPLLFLLIAVAVEWVQMAFTRGTGGAAHHVILMWPFVVTFIGIAFSAASRRAGRYGMPALTVAVGVLAAGNMMTTNRYLADFTVNGGTGGWTDAIYSLSASLGKESGSGIGLVDWGCLTPLWLLHEGDLPLFIPAIPAAGAVATESQKAELKQAIEDPTRLYVQHTDDKQLFVGVNDRFRKLAAELGYVEAVERVVHDRNGRPVFELFRFRKGL